MFVYLLGYVILSIRLCNLSRHYLRKAFSASAKTVIYSRRFSSDGDNEHTRDANANEDLIAQISPRSLPYQFLLARN